MEVFGEAHLMSKPFRVIFQRSILQLAVAVTLLPSIGSAGERLVGTVGVVVPALGQVIVDGRTAIVGRAVAEDVLRAKSGFASTQIDAAGTWSEGGAFAASTVRISHAATAPAELGATKAFSALGTANGIDARNAGVQGIIGTGVQGIIGTGVQGIIGTGVQGIIGTGLN